MATKNTVQFHRPAQLDFLESREACYYGGPFVPHTHDTLSIGIVEGGESAFLYRNQYHPIRRGGVAIIQPGEVHACNPTSQTLSYLMFYLDVAWVESTTQAFAPRHRGLPSFDNASIFDPDGFTALRTLQNTLRDLPENAQLEAESVALLTFSNIIRRHTKIPQHADKIHKEPAKVAQMKAYIDDHLDEKITLQDLAILTDLSHWHLLRLFRQHTGLPPHSYQLQRRIERAKHALRKGITISQVAMDAGFVDQAHFSRKFKQRVGATPRQYQQAH